MFQLYDTDNISTEDWREWTQSRRRIYSFDKASSSILSALKPQRKSSTKLHVIALEFFNFRFFLLTAPCWIYTCRNKKAKTVGKKSYFEKIMFFQIKLRSIFLKSLNTKKKYVLFFCRCPWTWPNMYVCWFLVCRGTSGTDSIQFGSYTNVGGWFTALCTIQLVLQQAPATMRLNRVLWLYVFNNSCAVRKKSMLKHD